MPDYTIIIIFSLAVIVFLLFNFSRDKKPRSRFIGDRSWSRQANYMFVDGIVLFVALVIIYILARIVRWAWIHRVLQQ
jgi:hypothetical protein